MQAFTFFKTTFKNSKAHCSLSYLLHSFHAVIFYVSHCPCRNSKWNQYYNKNTPESIKNVYLKILICQLLVKHLVNVNLDSSIHCHIWISLFCKEKLAISNDDICKRPSFPITKATTIWIFVVIHQNSFGLNLYKTLSLLSFILEVCQWEIYSL